MTDYPLMGVARVTWPVFRSTLRQSRPNKAGLKCWYVYVRAYVRPSVHKKFFRFQWNLACR